MKPLGHKVISASAGSGKTWQLTNRYIELLATGCAPERIAALTFSRKAAGEIFDRITGRLAEAALEASARRLLPSAGEGEAWSAAAVTGLLRRVLDAMPRLQIGTLDSFFARTVRAFPLELGISSDFQMLDDALFFSERQAALRRVLADGDPEGQRKLLRDFRDAVFGTDEKSATKTLSRLIEEGQQLYVETPGAEFWGTPQRIWPDPPAWLTAVEPPESAAIEALLTRHPAPTLKEAVEVFLSHRPGTAPKLNTLGKRLLEHAAVFASGAAEIKEGRGTLVFNAADCAVLDRLLAHFLCRMIVPHLQSTAGFHRLLARYEADYHARVRRQGRLAFSDLLLLLDQAPALTRNPGAGRLYIDYRLDGSFDHWLLDEFQDTSHAQWRVLRNLIDETVQAGTPERTFFYVGDIKQAIYGWRGGDSALFGQVAEYYQLEPEPLACSWRSSQRVLDVVNAVFGAVSQAEALDPLVRERWASVWQTHTAAQAELPGFVALYQRPKDLPEERDIWDAAARLVQMLTVEKPGTVGVLVRSNSHGERMAEALARCGVAAVWEGNSSVAATPEAAAFLALVRLAEHPGDRFAQRHVEMAPLNEKLKAHELNPRTVGPVVLRQIWAGGFEAALNAWLPEATEELRDAVRTFDTLNRRDTVGFIEFIENTRSAATAARSRVSVMTVHKAKGLEFDAVVLPDLQGRHALGTVVPEGLEVHRGGPEQSVAWILDFPPKAVAAADPVLNDHLRQVAVQQTVEELCVLYVAMTRARQGLYLLVEEPGKSAAAFYASRLLEQALAEGEPQPVVLNGAELRCLYRQGDPDWQPATGPEAVPPVEPVGWPDAVSRIPQRLERLLPSEAGESELHAGLLFNSERRHALRLGAALHALLEQIEWLDGPPEASAVFAGGEGTDSSEAPIRSLLLEALRQPEVRAVFERPATGSCEVWRERAFEVVLDGRWITGRFDRVVIFRDAAGRAVRAELVDFKCGRKENAERYAPQLTLYRRALARLLELSEEQVEGRLVFIEPVRSRP